MSRPRFRLPVEVHAWAQASGHTIALDRPLSEWLATEPGGPRVALALELAMARHVVDPVRVCLGEAPAWKEAARRLGETKVITLLNLLAAWLEGGVEPPKPIEPRPGMDPADVVTWARGLGAEQALSRPAAGLRHGLGWPEQDWLTRRESVVLTVGGLLSGPVTQRGRVGQGAPPTVWAAGRAFVETWGRLTRVAEAEAATKSWAPGSPRAEPLRDRLLALREAERAGGAWALGEREVAGVTLTVEEDAGCVRLLAHLLRSCSGTGMVRVEVPLRAGAGPRCECPGASGPCAGRRLALERVLDTLTTEGDPALAEQMIRISEEPAWAPMLRALDRWVAHPPPSATSGIDGWMVEVRGDVSVGLRPWRRRGRAIQAADLLRLARQPPSDLDPLDVEVLDILVPDPAAGAYAEWSVTRRRAWRALQKLAGRRTVLVEGMGETPVPVVEGRLGLAVRQAEAGTELVADLDGRGVDPSVLLAAIGDHDDGHAVLIDRAAPAVRLYRVPRGLPQLLAALAGRGVPVDEAGVPELMERLSALAGRVPTRADESFGDGEPIAPEVRVRLALGAQEALTLGLVVETFPGEPSAFPGEGEARRLYRRGAELAVGTRDLEAELADARAVVERLELPDPAAEGAPWTWVYTGPDEALDALERVQERIPADRVQWTGKPVRASVARAEQLKVTVGPAQDWFGLGGELDLDGHRVPLGALLQAMRDGRTVVPVDDRAWVRITGTLRARLHALAEASRAGARGETLSPYAVEALEGLVDEGVEVDARVDWRTRILRLREARGMTPEPPAGLRAELRPYQVEGYRWLVRTVHWADGAVLADDMGLGKTVQALAFLLTRAETGPLLVVAPTSVGFTWLREAERFAPTLRAVAYRGAGRRLGTPGAGELVVTSYELLVRDVGALAAVDWAVVVFDEAHALKNPQSRRHEAAARLQARARLALTGTPLENRLSELWSLFRVVLPGCLGSWEQFRDGWVAPIERGGDPEARQRLARRVQPMLLRRTKGAVAPELPSRTEVRVDVDLGAPERARYDDLRRSTVAALSGLDGATPPEQLRFKILAALTRLRQVACDLALVDPTWTGVSAKRERLLELLEELRAEERRVLVFSQFTSLLDRIQPALEAASFRVLRLDGSTPEPERVRAVGRFQAGEADVFLLSLKAGGTGLTLTAASDVVILDPWWNPAVEDQAADRAHRIGQTRAVTIWRLVSRGTVEEPMLALHAQKRDLVAGVLGGDADLGALGVDELLALVREGVTPARRR